MATATIVPSGYDMTKSSYASVSSGYPLANGLTNADSTTYTEVNISTGQRVESMLAVSFDFSAIPSGSTINSVSCIIKATISNTSFGVLSGTAQLYSGSTSVSGEIELGKSAISQTFNSISSMDYSHLQQMYLLLTASRGTLYASRNYTLDFYGATVTVNYTEPSTTPTTSQLKIKQNGSWTNVSKVYKKVNGLWIEQSDIAGLFSTSANYVRG